MPKYVVSKKSVIAYLILRHWGKRGDSTARTTK